MYEECSRCGAHTGNAGIGEDSLFVNDVGPLCEYCYDSHTLFDEVRGLRDVLKRQLDAYNATPLHAQSTWVKSKCYTLSSACDDLTTLIDKHDIPEAQKFGPDVDNGTEDGGNK